MSEAARFGLPMPNNPEMRFFWGPMETATAALVSGKPPKEVLDAAAKRIRER
jgi:maltose-binding protein MalE